jgi:hypothetical protein
MVEVPVAGTQDEVVLQHQSGDPQIIGRDRRPLPAQLAKDRSVVMRRLVVREQDGHPRLPEEAAQHALVFGSTRADGETGA